jgi:hypothetical protein
VLTHGRLDSAFALYWSDMDRCRQAAAYWSLLHVVVCVPDICAALESSSGETSGPRYMAWCDRYLVDHRLTGTERWLMRCKVLHQGRASTGRPGRYTGFSFAQPAPSGQTDHLRVEGSTLVLDVGRLADEMKVGVESWIRQLEADRSRAQAVHVERNLASLVQVRQSPLPSVPGVPVSVPLVINRTS